ncbi:ABC transporter substrate-binding protein [Devosia sp. SL43]|uniref:ABC transporter substrate-binding protein n=1 Tax=Devosia sp. SL43 TaxID=2806348 RepID=UPI001F2A9B1F|nr:extracellular solute-binding protein [Devosia sp. SL43]UJW84952.1 extracellular solute-binding protein [Devosia sp. SL43]
MKRFALAVSAVALFAHGALAQDVTIDLVHVQSNETELALMDELAAAYEADHPGVDINIRKFGEDYKQALSTMLQTNDAPDVIYSWGGGVLSEQIEAGLLRTIDGVIPDETKAAVGPAGVDAFTRDGQLYGIAQNVSEVVFWYNKTLFEQAGVDVATMSDWEGFLAGVQKLKDAGITPIAMASKDKWPTAFYWDYLALRLAGQAGLEAARRGDDGGFTAPEFVKASEEFLRLSAMQPYQPGFEGAGYAPSTGMFGDGQAAMILMGDWNYQESKTNSTSKEGVPDDQLGFFAFPTLEGQKGNDNDTLGGINGWVFAKDAPDAAVDFMVWYQQAANIARFAEGGYYIPINAEAAAGLANPFQQQIAKDINAAPYHAIFFDQSLGVNAGAAVNDVAAAITSSAISAEDAAAWVEDAMADDR